jgi:hypothetical protein
VSRFENDKVGFHPSMNIALHMNELLVVIGVREGRSTGGLDAVPFAIDFAERVNVVRERVIVGNAHILPDAKREDMGRVVATLLVKGGCGGWRRGGVVVTSGNVNDHILDGVAGPGDDILSLESARM